MLLFVASIFVFVFCFFVFCFFPSMSCFSICTSAQAQSFTPTASPPSPVATEITLSGIALALSSVNQVFFDSSGSNCASAATPSPPPVAVASLQPASSIAAAASATVAVATSIPVDTIVGTAQGELVVTLATGLEAGQYAVCVLYSASPNQAQQVSSELFFVR